MNPLPETVVHALHRAAASATATDGIRFLDRHENALFFDWATLAQRAQMAAGYLHAKGVKRHDRVALILPTCPEFIDAWLGCQLLGAVPVALYPPVRLGRLDEYFQQTATMIGSAQPVCIISDARVRRILGRLLPQVELPLGLLKAENLSKETTPIDLGPPQGNDLAMVQFSSGTTVAPKPVALTHRQILANADAIMDFFPHDDGLQHAGVSWLPLYHDMGLIGCILPALLRPGPLTLIPPEVFLAKPSIWLRAISRFRATLSPAPDFAYGLCTDRIRDEELDGCDLSSWRLAMNGAESVSPARAKAFTDRFSKWGLPAEAMTPVYGLSEASLAVTFSNPKTVMHSEAFESRALSKGNARILNSENNDAPKVELSSVGRPLRGFEIAIRTSEGTPCDEGVVGQLWVAGPSLMQGYLGETQSSVVDGWLKTGDLGFVLNGELYITGRAKDVIVLRGRNHNPQGIEESLLNVEGLRTGCVAAVGTVDSKGDRLLVFVESRNPTKDTAQRCSEAILSKTGLEPDLVMILEPGVLPRTSSGKIRRAETLKRWQQGTLSSPDKITPWLLTGALAKSFIGHLRGPGRNRP